MNIDGNEVLWMSEEGNIAIAYSQFDDDKKYRVYRKVRYREITEWDFRIPFETKRKAMKYAKELADTVMCY